MPGRGQLKKGEGEDEAFIADCIFSLVAGAFANKQYRDLSSQQS